MPSTHPGEVKTHRKALRSGFAAAVGTTVEWYDFYVYATAAAIVFPQVFFPEVDRSLGTLASFGTYAVAFFMRPLGGIIFGHVGDRLGRKPALTITLLIMGVATVLVGCLPDYATAGMLGPVLLIVFRMFQGLAVGGEWGGASLMSVESAPEKWKTFYGGFTQLGNPLGALLSSAAFWVLAAAGDDVLMSWGWRLPFLFSVILIGVGNPDFDRFGGRLLFRRRRFFRLRLLPQEGRRDIDKPFVVPVVLFIPQLFGKADDPVYFGKPDADVEVVALLIVQRAVAGKLLAAPGLCPVFAAAEQAPGDPFPPVIRQHINSFEVADRPAACPFDIVPPDRALGGPGRAAV